MAVTLRDLRKLLDPIRTKIRLMWTRAVFTAVRDGEGLQIIQVTGLPGEILDDVERFQNYGFTSVPLPGAEAIIGFIGGSRSHGVAVAADDRRHRKRGLQPGESAQYSDEGDFVHLKRGRIIAVNAGNEVDIEAGVEVKVTAPKIALAGSTEIALDGAIVKLTGTGAVTIDGLTVAITGTGAVTITGASLALGSVSTIDGKPFLAHQHSLVRSGPDDSGPVV